MNKMLGMTKNEQQQFLEQVGLHYKKPRSWDHTPKPLRSSAAGAAIAEARNVPPKVVGSIEDPATKNAFIQGSASQKIINKSLGGRKSAEQPTTNGQVLDRHSRARFDTIVQKAALFMSTVKPAEGSGVTATVRMKIVMEAELSKKQDFGGKPSKEATQHLTYIASTGSRENAGELLDESWYNSQKDAPGTIIWTEEDEHGPPSLKKSRSDDSCIVVPPSVSPTFGATATTSADSMAADDNNELAPQNDFGIDGFLCVV